MKKTLSLSKLIAAHQALAQVAMKELPADLGYDLALLARTIRVYVDPWDEQRKLLIRKYGQQDSLGNYTVLPGMEGHSHFVEEMNSLSVKECEIEFTPLSLKSLGKREFAQGLIMDLADFIEDDR